MDALNLAELRNKCLASLYACTENISKYVNESNRTEEFNKLKTYVTEYCKMELHEKAGNKAIQSFEEVTDIEDWGSLKSQYENKLAQYSNHQSKFDKHPFVKELEKYIRTAERRHGEQESEDLAITETVETYIDPISMRPITNPIRNKICNHVYDKKSIESIFTHKKTRCPYVGCKNKEIMLAQHLVLDEELLLTIKRSQQSNQLLQAED